MKSNILIQIELANAENSEIIWSNDFQAACTSDTPIEKADDGKCGTGNCQEKQLDDQNIMLNKDSSNFHWNPGIHVVRPTTSMCPIEQPMSGSSCPLPEGTQCSYGEECCCGECHTRWENPSNLISHSVSNTLSSLFMCSLFGNIDRQVHSCRS